MNLVAVRLDSRSYSRIYDEIASIHIASIHHGALPFLGSAFISRLYQELAVAPKTGVWVILQQEHVVAFLAGSADIQASFRAVVWRGLIPLTLGGMRALFSIALWRKLFALFLYPFRRHGSGSDNGNNTATISKAELLAVAVDASLRGQGAGRLLVDEFERFLKEWNVDNYFVTTNAAEVDSNAFYRRLGFNPSGQFPHHDLVLQRYWKKLEHNVVQGVGR